MKVQAHLVQKHNDKTDREEWAFVSEHSDKVLKWFGTNKPSKEEVVKEERRIQYFKHHSSLLSKILSHTFPKQRFIHIEADVTTTKNLKVHLTCGPFGDNTIDPKDFDPESEDFRIAALVGEKPIGYVDCYFEGGRLYAYEVAVDKKYQRKGVATAMYDWAQEISGRTINSHKDNGLGGAEISDDAEGFWKNRTKGDIVDVRFEKEPYRQDYMDALPFQGPWNGYGQKSPIEKVYPAISKVLGRTDPIKYPMLAKIEADIVDERFSDPHGGYRHDSALPIEDTYGWGWGQGPGEFGTATENNPMGQGVRRAFAGDKDFKGFDDPWKVMSPEDRKEANRLFKLAMKAFPSSPKQKELQEKLKVLFKKYKIGE